MQSIKVVCIGKVNADYFAKGCEEYLKRCRAMAQMQLIELPEAPLDDKKPSEVLIARALEKEGKAILAQLGKNSRLVALCIEGRSLSSEQLSAYFADCAMCGCDIVFAIGSSYGLAPLVKQRADLRLSMSQMTFPHQLARLMLSEQIYRALTLQNGIKYHK